MIEGGKKLLLHATDYYKNLFGPVRDSMDISLEVPVPRTLNEEDSGMLSSTFTLEEIKDALFSMKHNKASGPYDFPAKFYQHYWDLIKFDVLEMFNEFYHGRLDVARLNYGIITLLPKCQEAYNIPMYRHMCLINVS